MNIKTFKKQLNTLKSQLLKGKVRKLQDEAKVQCTNAIFEESYKDFRFSSLVKTLEFMEKENNVEISLAVFNLIELEDLFKSLESQVDRSGVKIINEIKSKIM